MGCFGPSLPYRGRPGTPRLSVTSGARVGGCGTYRSVEKPSNPPIGDRRTLARRPRSRPGRQMNQPNRSFSDSGISSMSLYPIEAIRSPRKVMR